MRAYIIHNGLQTMSRIYARKCLDSFKSYRSWTPKVIDGCNPSTLRSYEERYKISNDRTNWPPWHDRYRSKKSCFYSHYELWLKASEMHETIAILEHDTYCIGDIPDGLSFKGALQLSVESAARLKLNRIYRNDYDRLMSRAAGVHALDICKQVEGYTPLIANMAYAITPEAAAILVEDCQKHGWYQNDDLITTKYCDIEYLLPSVIEYDQSRELGTSINYAWGEDDRRSNRL